MYSLFFFPKNLEIV
uniref:Photosystem II protein I n=1 Tax=Camellia weiningensis TaxID=542758 RepID=A0A6B9JEM7_9ERIC|nr:photosystem II protein I [Camellia weiningensis]